MDGEALTRTVSPRAARGLTTLSFLAQRRKHTEVLLEAALAGRLDDLAEVALEVAVDTGDPLGTILARRLSSEGSAALMDRLAERLTENPYASVLTLREVSIVVLRRCLDDRRESWAEPDDEQRGVLATLALNLGQDLSYLGRWPDATAAFEEALETFRTIENPDPSTLSAGLLEYGAHLTKIGRQSEALEASREAVALRRRMAADDTNDEVMLAGALNNVAADLSDLGFVDESLEAATEAVEIFERRHKDLDDFGLHRFANTLICQGNQLGDLGRYAEAREALERAVALRRRLAVDWHSAFQPDLALALADLALLLYNTDHEEEAFAALDEATSIYRRLAEDRHAAFGPDLVWSMSRGLVPSGLTTSRQTTKMVEMLEQAVHLLRFWAGEYPSAFRPRLAEALRAFAEQLLKAGRPRPALTVLEEAVALLQDLSKDPLNPSAHLVHDLGWCMVHRAKALGTLGQWVEAVDDAREAVEIFHKHVNHLPTSLRNLAAAHHELGIRLHVAGRFEEALDVTGRGVDLYRRLAAEHPGVFRTELGSVLVSLGIQLHAVGDLEASAVTSREAVELCREIVGGHGGDRYLDMLAVGLSNQALALRYLGRPEKALPVAREAVEAFDTLEGTYSYNEEHLADCQNTLGVVLDDLGEVGEARSLFEEAVASRRRLAREVPQACPVDLAFCLTNLGVTLGKAGQYEEAVRAGHEAAEILRRAVKEGRRDLRSRLGATLGNLAHQLRELARPQEAVVAASESLAALIPLYADLTEELQKATLRSMGHYLEGSKECDVEPDFELMEPLISACVAASTS